MHLVFHILLVNLGSLLLKYIMTPVQGVPSLSPHDSWDSLPPCDPELDKQMDGCNETV